MVNSVPRPYLSHSLSLCRGFAVISKHKDLRLSKIAEYLATGELDIVALQEVTWLHLNVLFSLYLWYMKHTLDVDLVQG